MNSTSSYQQDVLRLQALLVLSQVQQQLSRSHHPTIVQATKLPPPAPQVPTSLRQALVVACAARQAAKSATPPPPPIPTHWTPRQRFFTFTKVLFRYLQRAQVDDRPAKLVVAKCVRQSKLGLLPSSSLVTALARELRQCVGHVHWARATRCFHSYCTKLRVGGGRSSSLGNSSRSSAAAAAVRTVR